MRRSRNKLTLNRETLRLLDLRAVVGGNAPITTDPEPSGHPSCARPPQNCTQANTTCLVELTLGTCHPC
jgi:hypothetical protein